MGKPKIKVELTRGKFYTYSATLGAHRGGGYGPDNEGWFNAIKEVFMKMYEAGEELPFDIEFGPTFLEEQEEEALRVQRNKEREIREAKRVLIKAGLLKEGDL